MTFADEIATLKSRAEDQLHALNTEEKTKNALIFPFIEALGFHVFDVREVEPEFTVDVGGGEVEKTDYAMKRSGTPLMLLSFERAGTGLDSINLDSLHNSLQATEANVGVLTNGIIYRFFVDMPGEENTGRPPFLEFNLLNHGSEALEDLKRMRKAAFDAEEIVSAARDRKDSRLLSEYLERQQSNPDRPFVRFMAEQVYEGQVTESVLDRLEPVVRKVLREFGHSETGGRPKWSERVQGDPSEGEGDRNGGLDDHPTKKILKSF